MRYTINILEKNNEIYCNLNKIESQKLNIEFELTTIIGDFLNIRETVYTKNKVPKTIYNYKNHIFTNDNSYLSSIDSENITKTFSALDKILSLPQGLSSLTTLKFEELKHILSLSFYYTLSTASKDDSSADVYDSLTLDDFNSTKKQNYWFTYHCDSICDLVFAILHYYVINNYKFVQCNHCKLFFATKTLKQKYCNRISPYINVFSQKKSTPTNCEQTVRNTKQQFSRQRMRISNKILHTLIYVEGKNDFYYDFQNMCYYFKKLIDKSSSFENLDKYGEYLNKIEKERGWLIK